jgi:hypothetical protein
MAPGHLVLVAALALLGSASAYEWGVGYPDPVQDPNVFVPPASGTIQSSTAAWLSTSRLYMKDVQVLVCIFHSRYLAVQKGTPIPADTVRIVHLGTGTPGETHQQVSTGILVQLSNGTAVDNFIFDLGTCSMIHFLPSHANIGVTALPVCAPMPAHFANDVCQGSTPTLCLR